MICKHARGTVWHTILDDINIEEGVIAKSRPCLIISNNHNNNLMAAVNVIPISTSSSTDDIGLIGSYQFDYNGITEHALCQQIKTINKYRLEKYMFTIGKTEMKEISDMVTRVLCLTESEENFQDAVLIGVPKRMAGDVDDPQADASIRVVDIQPIIDKQKQLLDGYIAHSTPKEEQNAPLANPVVCEKVDIPAGVLQNIDLSQKRYEVLNKTHVDKRKPAQIPFKKWGDDRKKKFADDVINKRLSTKQIMEKYDISNAAASRYIMAIKTELGIPSIKITTWDDETKHQFVVDHDSMTIAELCTKYYIGKSTVCARYKALTEETKKNKDSEFIELYKKSRLAAAKKFKISMREADRKYEALSKEA